MATYKRISGDYNIISIDPSAGDNVNIVTNTVNITGNLDVTGNVTYINVNDLTVDDPFITVAGNNAGNISTAPFQQQGLVAQTSANTFAGIRFDNGSLRWQVSGNVYGNGAPIDSYANLAVATSIAAGSSTQIQYNMGGVFAANANFTFDSTSSKFTLNGHQIYGNIGTTPASVANSVAVYNKAIGSGGTGLYVKSSSVDDELVSKSAAIVFAIIF
jgi:hypothetical protein